MEVPVAPRRLEETLGAPDPGAVMRRSLVAWGLGYLALGDQRGWIWLVIEVVWLAALGVSLTLLPTDRWLIAYVLLSGFIVVWVAQAVAAYRSARARSGRSTGAGWLLALAPVVIILLTGFWLFAGAKASPSATFERYIGAWRHGDAAAAVGMFAQATEPALLKARWEREERLISDRIARLADADPEFSLDRENPETNLRFDLHDPAAANSGASASPVLFDMHVVRQVIVPTTFFGVVPASRTEARIVDTVGQALLVRRSIDGPLAATGAAIWLIDSIHFAGEP